ncbi:hypothetical protein O9G_000454 [Rozella allomycis CSF55]|uniref:ZFAND2A/B-like C2H2 zinc finger domain-containing protein n=1 Tax=Rozella allomycis (strain CSF55) TaxID=988480 RepID=A0A075AYR7_ROZAC|nr:hypothetical protein O9G_000454 [Rozella allomycis CSF55]|eukprot:EPZ33679.1 hypothetical protein O9G_000454 [Rozella allomycis CSF55]
MPRFENHWKPGDHSCVKRREYELKRDNKTIDCPVCSLPISIPFGQDPNIYVARKLKFTLTNAVLKNAIRKWQCALNVKIAIKIIA